jgi:Nif-specific regulatory protein
MPKLVSIAGPLCGGIFPLAETQEAAFSIGRAVSNSLCVEDPLVSRHHCVVTRKGSQYILTDRGSVNRTYVNGLPMEEHPLRNGDEVKIGESLFVFLANGGAESETGGPDPLLEKTIHLHRTQVVRAPLPTQFAEGPADPPGSPAGARGLEALLSIGEAIPASLGLDGVERDLLAPLGWAFSAERATLVLAARGQGDAPSLYEWKSELASDGAGPPAAALVDRMVREPQPILWNRPSKPAGGAAGTLDLPVGPQVNGLAVVPLVAFQRLIGALCLTSKNHFDERQFRFLKKASGLVAGVVSHAVNAREQATAARLRRAEINLEHNMVGEGPLMRRVYETIAKVAPTDSTVLIRGESGTGKELAARAIHRSSLRAASPFIAINCAALTETLLESELFGHEKGAFTGAVAQKKGKLEEAAGGTIFFDEIGEMSAVLQAKLLRVLQEREFERVGGTRTVKADVRVIAATNRDLDEAIRRGAFRSDLYFRLNVISLAMPPLREHPEDIDALANHFAQKHSRKLKRRIAGISKQAYVHLRGYDWPGNVRELENVVERALVLGATDMIQPEDLPDSVLEASAASGGPAGSFHASIKEAKKRLIAETLQRTEGNLTEAAKLLDLHPNSLHRIIRNLNAKAKSAD